MFKADSEYVKAFGLIPDHKKNKQSTTVSNNKLSTITSNHKQNTTVSKDTLQKKSLESEEEDEEEDDGDESSSSSEESNGASDVSNEDKEEGDTIINVGGAKKPTMRLPTSDLKSRLSTFLPQLAAANAELEILKENGGLKDRQIDNVQDGEGDYIEMDLGLGVLEEKPDGGKESSSEDDDEDVEPLDKLKGQHRSSKGKAQIQEMESTR